MLVSSVLGGRSHILLLVACWGFPCLMVGWAAGLHPQSLGTPCGAWSRVCRGRPCCPHSLSSESSAPTCYSVNTSSTFP